MLSWENTQRQSFTIHFKGLGTCSPWDLGPPVKKEWTDNWSLQITPSLHFINHLWESPLPNIFETRLCQISQLSFITSPSTSHCLMSSQHLARWGVRDGWETFSTWRAHCPEISSGEFQVSRVLGLRGTLKTPELRTVSVPQCALWRQMPDSDQDSATFWFVWPGTSCLLCTSISSSVQWGRCDVSLASCKMYVQMLWTMPGLKQARGKLSLSRPGKSTSVPGHVVLKWDIVTVGQLPWLFAAVWGSWPKGSFISCGPCGAKPPSWHFLHVSWHPFPHICLGKDCFIKKHPRCLLLAPCSSLFALCLHLPVFNATFLKGWAPEYNYPHLRRSAPEAASISKHKWNVSSERLSLDFKVSLFHFLICC